MLKKILKVLLNMMIGYVVVGSIYYISGYLVNVSRGKEEVFSPIIGYPLTIIGWPFSLHADFIHRESLGLKLSFPITVLAIILVVIWLSWQVTKEIDSAQ